MREAKAPEMRFDDKNGEPFDVGSRVSLVVVGYDQATEKILVGDPREPGEVRPGCCTLYRGTAGEATAMGHPWVTQAVIDTAKAIFAVEQTLAGLHAKALSTERFGVQGNLQEVTRALARWRSIALNESPGDHTTLEGIVHDITSGQDPHKTLTDYGLFDG